MELVFEDAADQVSRGRSWRGTPFQLGPKTYTNGLAFNATKHLRVRLGQPGERFTAEIGLENNDDTQRGAGAGNGSVTFHVRVGDQEVFASPVLRLADGGRQLDVPLNGASEFEIRVGDGGDGRGWDQALWAEPKVRLVGGGEVLVAGLPLEEPVARPVTPVQPPFSFVYGGKPSAELLPQWESRQETRPLEHGRTEHVMWRRDPATGLEVRCVAVAYAGFPTVEWTVWFKNTGAADSPLLEEIQALDVEWRRRGNEEFVLHHHVGSDASGNDYGVRQTVLRSGATHRLGGVRGRPTGGDWSYFNLEWGGRGTIVAVGWPGQWAADFACDAGRGLRLRAGQERTRFRLLPGEEVRTPLMVLQFWEGDWIRGQNVWRRWMLAHSVPRPGGRLPAPMLLASSSRQYDEMIRANETNQVMFIDRYREERIGLDYWWMDAGWYVHHGGGWPRVGTWLVDSNRFPRGLRAVSDHAHRLGMKTLVWFEPERVTPGTWLAENHPDWILGGARGGLLNLGNNAAREWFVEHVDRLLTEQGIDLYRQDFNMDPLDLWRAADAPEREGISEMRHVQGYLAYWDELRRRHPNMLIDTCASGGRRNDLETLRRAVPLWRSDYAYEATGHQCMTYGISLWVPYHGTGTVATRNAPYYGSGPSPVEPYAFWSNVTPSLGLGIDVRERGLDYAALRRLIALWRQVAPNYFGDFYPLTPWTRDGTVWMAWQFDRPEAGEGMVQVFRRPDSFYEAARFPLRGLEAAASYRVVDIERGEETRCTGAQLLESGLAVTISERPGARVLTYRRAGGTQGK